MPAWVPDNDQWHGFSRFDCSRAIAAGLTFRPLSETIRDTLDWARSFPSDHAWQAGLSREREREVLEAWHAASTVKT
jgi:2'-hydroxyisoflavone reductase